MNVKDIRRENTRQLAHMVGGITALGIKLGKTQAQISHLIGKRPLKNIGDRLAQQIERAFNKSYGWLDKLHPEISYTNGQSAAASKNSDEEKKLQWLPLISWEQIPSFIGKTKDVIALAVEYFPTQLDMTAKSFAVRVQNTDMKKTAGIDISKDAVFVIDCRIPAHDGALVLVHDDKNEINLHHFQAALHNQDDTEAKQADKNVVGLVRQVIVTL